MTGLPDSGRRGAAYVWLRSLIAVIAAAGILGGAAQAHARVVRERVALEARVDTLRQAINQVGSDLTETPGHDTMMAQWFNWPNWNNWNNWPNWGNWGNWGNWFNR